MVEVILKIWNDIDMLVWIVSVIQFAVKPIYQIYVGAQIATSMHLAEMNKEKD